MYPYYMTIAFTCSPPRHLLLQIAHVLYYFCMGRWLQYCNLTATPKNISGAGTAAYVLHGQALYESRYISITLHFFFFFFTIKQRILLNSRTTFSFKVLRFQINVMYKKIADSGEVYKSFLKSEWNILICAPRKIILEVEYQNSHFN